MSIGLQRSQLALSHLLGTGGVTGTPPKPTFRIGLGHPGNCPTKPTLLICIFDDSGSMLGGSDSTGHRYLEAELAFERISRRCACDREMAAILHMNRPTSADRPALLLNRRAKSDLVGGLMVPRDGDGASAMADTLARAHQIATVHPDHRATLVAFSDYELVDNMPTLTADMASFPGSVHAVVMRSKPPAELIAEDTITVTHVANGEPPGAVARALFASITAHRPGASSAATTGKDG